MAAHIEIEIFEFGFFDGSWTVTYDELDQIIDLCQDMGLEVFSYEAGQLLLNATNFPQE